MADDTNEDIVRFAASYASLVVTTGNGNGNGNGNGKTKIRIGRRNAADLMHTIGYYFEQNPTKLRDVPVRAQIRMVADVMGYIESHLEG